MNSGNDRQYPLIYAYDSSKNIQVSSLSDAKSSSCWNQVNSLPNDKILYRFKFKAFADNKINLSEKLKFVLGRVENIVGKEEDASFQHFLLFLQCL